MEFKDLAARNVLLGEKLVCKVCLATSVSAIVFIILVRLRTLAYRETWPTTITTSRKEDKFPSDGPLLR